MAYVPSLKTKYKEEIAPALMKEFGYKSIMQVPKLEKIVINQGVGAAVADKKLVEVAQAELSTIAGQHAVQTRSKKDISNFKLRKQMPIGVRSDKFDGQGNYTLGVQEHIIFPEIDIDKITKIFGVEITFVTTAGNDTEAYALLKQFGLPFKNAKKN